jgi:hypothetical protein
MTETCGGLKVPSKEVKLAFDQEHESHIVVMEKT